MASGSRGSRIQSRVLLSAGLNGSVAISTFTGTISNGSNGTFAGTLAANPGSLLINLTTLKLYINTNTKASPTWTIVGTQS